MSDDDSHNDRAQTEMAIGGGKGLYISDTAHVKGLFDPSETERHGTTVSIYDTDELRTLLDTADALGWDSILVEMGHDLPILVHPAGERMDHDEYQDYMDGVDVASLDWSYDPPEVGLALAPETLARLPADSSADLVDGREDRHTDDGGDD